jgi:predicted transcriptional regulator
MPSTTVRVDSETRESLRQLASDMNVSMQEALGRAVEAFRRAWLLEQLNAHYAELRADPEAWAEELAERRLWDTTLMDGLEGDPYPLDPDQLAALEAATANRAAGGDER